MIDYLLLHWKSWKQVKAVLCEDDVCRQIFPGRSGFQLPEDLFQFAIVHNDPSKSKWLGIPAVRQEHRAIIAYPVLAGLCQLRHHLGGVHNLHELLTERLCLKLSSTASLKPYRKSPCRSGMGIPVDSHQKFQWNPFNKSAGISTDRPSTAIAGLILLREKFDKCIANRHTMW